MLASVPPLTDRLRLPVLLGLTVGLVRFVLEFAAPDRAMLFGLYYVIPLALLVIGLRGAWGPIRWPQMAFTLLVLCLIVWGISNTVAYTTGQFLEWQHGRFFHAGTDEAGNDLPGSRAAPIAAHPGAKIGWGLLQGVLTSLAGTVWCVAIGTITIWLPAKMRTRS